MRNLIQLLEEIDGFQILTTTIAVRYPFTAFTGVVEVQHGGYRIHAKAVDMVLVQPEQGVGDQIVLHFVAAVVVNQRAPVGVRTLARVGMLVEMRAVEQAEAVRVARKMSRSPIEENSDCSLMATIDKLHEIAG